MQPFWCILTHVYTFRLRPVNTVSINIKNFVIIPQNLFMVLCSQVHRDPHPRSPLVFVLTVVEFYVNGPTQYVLFYFGFLHLAQSL